MMNNFLTEKLATILSPILATHQQSITSHLDGINLSIKALSKDIAVTKDDAERSNERQNNATQPLIERLNRLENYLGKPDGREDKSLEDRLELIELTLENLLKRINDLEAARLSDLSSSSTTMDAPVAPVSTDGQNEERSVSVPPQEDSAARDEVVHDGQLPSPQRDDDTDDNDHRHGQVNADVPRSPSHHSPSPFSCPIRASKPLVPVDWSTHYRRSATPLGSSNYPGAIPSPLHSESDDQRDAVQFFRPQYSAEATNPYMVLPDYFLTSSDDTIASLRRNVLQDTSMPALEYPDGVASMDMNSADCSQMLASPPCTERTPSTSLDQIPTMSNLSISKPNNGPEKLSIQIPTTPPSPCGSLLSPLTPLSDFDDDDLQSPEEDSTDHNSARTLLRKRKAGPIYAPLAKRTRRKSTHDTVLNDVKIEWPEKRVIERYRFNFIQCDRCRQWYHYACAGVIPGDSRLEVTEIYICPACNVSTPKRGKRQQSVSIGLECGRPDCDRPLSQEYTIERIVGRAVKQVNDEDAADEPNYIWLIKWDGYPIEQATWEVKEHLGDPESLVENFNRAARAEGLDLDTPEIIFLEEARSFVKENRWY